MSTSGPYHRLQDSLGAFSIADLGLVDGVTSPAFDALTRLALRVVGAKVALISIIDEEQDRQFFASEQGLPDPWKTRRQTPLSHSFCQHVKRSEQPLIVADARCHPLVKDNLAIRDLNVAAYLGVPIRKPDGKAIGALCVIEPEAREWTAQDLAVVIDLATCVNEEITLRASLKANAAVHAKTLRYTRLRESIAMAFMAPDLPVEERFKELLRAGCTGLEMTNGTLAKFDGHSSKILFRYDETATAALTPKLASSQTLASLVYQGQEQIYFSDVQASNARGQRTLSGDLPGSYAGTPLIFDGVLYGVLEFSNPAARPKIWSDEELSVLSIMSMFACAYLGVYGQIQSLRDAEAALLNYLMETKRGPASNGMN